MSSSDHDAAQGHNGLQEMLNQSQQFFKLSSGTNQNREEIIPEIEMKLGPFGTGLQRGFRSVDRAT